MSNGMDTGVLAYGAPSISKNTTDRYLWPFGNSSMAATSDRARTELEAPVPIHLIGLQVITEPGTSTTNITYTVQVNGVDSSLAVTMAANVGDASEVETVAVAAGDRVSIKVSKSGVTSSPPSFMRALIFFSKDTAS